MGKSKILHCGKAIEIEIVCWHAYWYELNASLQPVPAFSGHMTSLMEAISYAEKWTSRLFLAPQCLALIDFRVAKDSGSQFSDIVILHVVYSSFAKILAVASHGL